MFLPFLLALRAGRVPVSLREYLGFLEAVAAGLVTYDLTGFYTEPICRLADKTG